MWCPKCASVTKVIGTHLTEKNTVIRFRICKMCDIYFLTKEFRDTRENIEKYLKSLEHLPKEIQEYHKQGFEKYL